jgi:VRR-NUC domain
MLADDEFLACSKVGDSGNGGGRRSRSSTNGGTGMIRQTGDSTAGQKKVLSLDDMPPRLELVYNGHVVIPECLFVEVKSSNDRLDARQEDWLNILDRSGNNCRVCKFEASAKNRQAGKKAAPKSAP